DRDLGADVSHTIARRPDESQTNCPVWTYDRKRSLDANVGIVEKCLGVGGDEVRSEGEGVLPSKDVAVTEANAVQAKVAGIDGSDEISRRAGCRLECKLALTLQSGKHR